MQAGYLEGRNDGDVLRNKAIPEAEHVVFDGIDRLAAVLLPIGRFFFDQPQGDEVFEVGSTNTAVLPDLGNDLVHL